MIKSKIHATGSETSADTIWLWQLLTHITHICMHSHKPTSMHSLSHTCMHSDTYMHTDQDNTVWHWRVCNPLKLLVKILYGGTLQSFTLCEKVSCQWLLPQRLPVHVFSTGDPNTSYTHKCMNVHTRTHTLDTFFSAPQPCSDQGRNLSVTYQANRR